MFLRAVFHSQGSHILDALHLLLITEKACGQSVRKTGRGNIESKDWTVPADGTSQRHVLKKVSHADDDTYRNCHSNLITLNQISWTFFWTTFIMTTFGLKQNVFYSFLHINQFGWDSGLKPDTRLPIRTGWANGITAGLKTKCPRHSPVCMRIIYDQ